ncbi:DUF221-domain-containing protein [Ceraceosorus guamensis]|uniref:DUF221-domain-containing protein n=1 Tax=Ceraceosorus guamensis TaxID=1522189 RepID=A0A316W0P6_9BASI|nr:DUF221-domain-containing protein [Ceraceosorus guamensis]PWN43269.1 DUF221-domain-containing protein [Ceraceosorus guamensis]
MSDSAQTEGGGGGGGNVIADRLSAALNDSAKLDGGRVAIAAGAFIGLAAITLLGFELVRGNNKMVYEPKRKYAEAGAPPLKPVRYRPLGWLTKYSEEELLPLVGLDAITFLRFTRMMRWLTTCLAILLCAVLIPVDLVSSANGIPTSGGNDQDPGLLRRFTIQAVSGGAIWAHVIMSYVATGVIIFFLIINYRKMVQLRWAWFRSPEYQDQFYARTLMMTNVPKQLQSDAALSGLLSTIGMPYPTTEVHIGRVVGALPDLIEKHEETVRNLERVLARYLRDPNKVPAKRPTVKVGGIFGRTVDAIDHYTEQIQKYEAAINQWRERIAEKKPESFGFASLASVPYAHAAARSLRGKKTQGVRITLAPAPKDVIWHNLTLSNAARRRSSVIGFLWLVLLCFVNAVPLLAVALISQMATFRDIHFLGAWYAESAATFQGVAALVPPAISGLFGYFLPILMRRIAKYRGTTTRTRLDRIITSQYFAFLVISQFLIFTLVGVAISVIVGLINRVGQHESFGQIFNFLRGNVANQILVQYISFSNYWMTFLPLRLWVALFDLAQGVRLVFVWFQKHFLGRTPRDFRDFSKPPVAEYAILYANLLFVFAVAMLYACVAPLVVAFAACVFWTASIVFKYQLIYVYRTKSESGGRLWRVIVNRILACIVFMQLILALALLLRGNSRLQAIAALPPVLAVVGFKIYCAKTFDQRFDWYIPNAQELATCKVHGGDQRHNRLQRRFGHPALHQQLFTPMVHARVKHLLPQIYRGRMEASTISNIDGRKTEVEEMEGGLRIAAIEEQDLEYDPHTDSDVRSVMSGTTFAGVGTPTGYGPPSRAGTAPDFENQYANYLAGVDAPSLPPAGDQDYEMGNIGGLAMHGSRDNLLEKTHPGSLYSDHTLMGSGGHGKKGSQGQYSYYTSSPGPTPGLDQVPQTNYTPGGGRGHQATSSAGGGYFPRVDASGDSRYQQYYNNGPQQGQQELRHQASHGTFAPGSYYTASPQGSPRAQPQRMYGGPQGRASPGPGTPGAAAAAYGGQAPSQYSYGQGPRQPSGGYGGYQAPGGNSGGGYNNGGRGGGQYPHSRQGTGGY